MASEALVDTTQEMNQQSIEHCKYPRRVVLKSIIGRDDGGIGLVGQKVVVGGWVKSSKEKARTVVAVADVTCPEVLLTRVPIFRAIAKFLGKGSSSTGTPSVGKGARIVTKARNVPFVAYLMINDGSSVLNLQVVVDSSLYPLGQIMHVGTCIIVAGVIEKLLEPTKHAIELKAEEVLHVGDVDLGKYPLGKTRLPLDLIRLYPHLRPRTTMIACITRIRNCASHSTHLFFQTNGFIHVHMPVITTTKWSVDDEVFQVTTTLLDKREDEMKDKKEENVDLKVVKAAISAKSTQIEELKRSESNKEVLLSALLDHKTATELAQQLEQKQSEAISIKDSAKEFSENFFSRPAYLTVSSGLHLESYVCALGNVYTFGPAFQAQETNTSTNNLAEKWLTEAALAFTELEEVMNCAEDCLKYLCKKILENCPHDMQYMSKRIDHNCIDRLKIMELSPFPRITYAEALDILNKADENKIGSQVQWGTSLTKEHESYLADEIFKQPVIIFEYPKEVKPFYVRVSNDGRTVSAFDIIAPKAGVLVQGSQKEERIKMIDKRIQEVGLPREQLQWYLDLRRNGTVKHSGFSLFFENLVMFTTGISDIRDAIPFPRARGYADI